MRQSFDMLRSSVTGVLHDSHDVVRPLLLIDVWGEAPYHALAVFSPHVGAALDVRELLSAQLDRGQALQELELAQVERPPSHILFICGCNERAPA
jgi:hypothetical protein